MRKRITSTLLPVLAISLSLSVQPASAQNTYGLPWEHSDELGEDSDFNPEDYIGYQSPPFQLLFHHNKVKNLTASQIFSDGEGAERRYEIELENQSFKPMEFRWRLEWYNADGDSVAKDGSWRETTLAPFTSLILESQPQGSKGRDLILHIDKP